jgi:hypothetical protein
LFPVKYGLRGGDMKRKVSARRVSDKSKNKEMEKKIKAVLRSSEKTDTKKKEVKKAESKIGKNKKTGIKAGVKEEKKPVKTRSKGKKKEIPKKVVKKSPAEEKKKPEKIKKKAISKAEKKIPPKVATKRVAAKKVIAGKPVEKVKAGRKKQPKEATKKAESRVQKKIPAGKVKEVGTKKAKKKPEKSKIRFKAAAKETPKKAERKISVKVVRKVSPEAAKERAVKIPEIRGEKIETPAMVREKEKVYPVAEEKYPPLPWEILPTEYGENYITLMTVDPFKLFAFWEVREDTTKIFKGDLTVRIYDITGIDFDSMDANSYLDIRVAERIGKRYIDVGSDKEFIADIGIIYEGIFITIARSHKVSTPRATVSEEGELPQEFL